MIPQLKILASVTEESYIPLRNQMMFMVGIVIGVLFSGILVTLGVSSLMLFRVSSKRGALLRQDRLLCVYTTVLLFLVIAFEGQAFVMCSAPILLLQPPRKVLDTIDALLKTSNATITVIWGLTDGLLVWRCFMVQRAMGQSLSKWGNTFWIFPACLWGLGIAGGVTASVLSGVAQNYQHKLFDIIGAITLALNVVLNLYAACFISTRLLLHRRMVIACVGDKAPVAQHLYLVGIFLESAAVNIPVTIAAAVGVGMRSFFGTVIMLVAPAGQALASVLIIHQVALGRAFSQERGAEIQELMKSTDGSSSENPENRCDDNKTNL